MYLIQNENFESSQRISAATTTTASSDTVNNNNNNNTDDNTNISNGSIPLPTSNNRLSSENNTSTINLDLSRVNNQSPLANSVPQQTRATDVEHNSPSNQQHQFQIQKQHQLQSPTAVDNPILSEFDLVASLNRYEKDKGKACHAPLEPPSLNYFSKPHHPPLQQQVQQQQPKVLQHQKFQKALLANPSTTPGPLTNFSCGVSRHQQPIPSPTAAVASASALVVTCLPKQPTLVHSQSITEKMSDAYLSGVKPDKLKNQNAMRQGPTSAPNTPESIRKQHLQLYRGRMDPMSMSLHDKREKMEFNQMMMRMGERDTRPLSVPCYHGRSVSLVGGDPRLDPSGGMVVNKRHLTSSATNRSRKESTLLNRRSMPTPHLENRYRDKFGKNGKEKKYIRTISTYILRC